MHKGVSSGLHREMRSLSFRAKSKSSLGIRWIGVEWFMAMSGSDVWVSKILGNSNTCVISVGGVRRRSLVACCLASNLISLHDMVLMSHW